MRRALALVVLLVLVAPASAFAHASVLETKPSYRERLERAPRTVWVRFDQGVKALPNSIVVLSADGTVVSRATRNGGRSAHDRDDVEVAAEGRVHGALARALVGRARRVGRLDVRRRRRRAAADGGVRRVWPDAHRASRSLGVLRRARAARSAASASGC